MPAMRALLAATFLAGLTACAGLVTANDGNKVTVEHDGFVSVATARDVALKSCQQAGKANATFLASANKNPSLPAGTGVQLSTYSCE